VEIPPRKALKVGLWLFLALGVAVFVASYLGVRFGGPLGGGGEVALVRVEGPIMDTREQVKTIRGYAKDHRIKALVLRVDSPGGGVVASQELHDAVAAFKEGGKPVVTSMGTVAASGGYYVSAPSTLIVANPGTLTGSIGVIMSMANVEKLLDKLGVSAVTIKAGRNKDIGSPFRAMTDEERALMQTLMDDIHNQFIAAVADGRGKSVEEITPLADGRVFTGHLAVEAGLVDELGNLETAIRRAGELAGIEGRPRVIEKEPGMFSHLMADTRSWFPWLPAAGPGGVMGPQAMYLMTW
jgi:protease-4